METGSGLWGTGMAGEGRGREVLTPLPAHTALLSAEGECGRSGVGTPCRAHNRSSKKCLQTHLCSQAPNPASPWLLGQALPSQPLPSRREPVSCGYEGLS